MPEFFKDWGKTDSALLGSALLAILGDIETSKANPGSETNPVLPGDPSNATYNAVGLVSASVAALAAGMLPKKQRRALLGAWAGLEATVAHDNAKGIGRGQDFLKSMERPLMGALIGGLLGSALDSDAISVKPGNREFRIGYERRF